MDDDLIGNPLSTVLAPTQGDVAQPWDWIPDSWRESVPPPAAGLQPGIGIPANTLEAAAAQVQPAPDEVDPSTVNLGYPHAPTDAPPPAAAIAMQNAPAGVVPGIGIPSSVFDPAAAQVAPLPDAITGADVTSSPAPIDAEQMFPAPPAEPEEIQFGTDDGNDFTTAEGRASALAGLNDVDLAGVAVQHEEARRQQGVTRMLNLATQAAKDAEFDHANYLRARDTARANRDSAAAAAQKLANEPLNTETSLSTKLRGVLMAIGGGLIQHLNGGKNVGLDLFDKEIERDVANAKQDRQMKLDALGMSRQAAEQSLSDADADAHDAAAYRAGAWQRMANQIDLEQQNFDPAGTTALRFEVAKREAKARGAKALIDYEEAETKRLEAQGKSTREIAQILETHRKNDADIANDKIRTRNDGTRAYADLMRAQTDAAKEKNTTQLLSPAYYANTYKDNPVPPHEMTRKEYAEFVELSAKGPKSQAEIRQSSAVAAKNERENSPENIAGELGAGDLTDNAGKPLLFRDSSAAAKVAKQRAAVDNSTRLLDQLLIARKRYGWTSDLFKSDAWRAAKADIGALTIEVKNADELGALSGPDMGLIEQQLSTNDPTTLQDPSAGWEQARTNLVNGFNSTLIAEARPGQKPKRYEPVKTAEAKSYENSLSQNLDIWDSPLMKAKDPEIRKRAHEDAVKSSDAIARQANPGTLKAFASDMRARHDSKDISDDQYESAMKPIRREFLRRMKASNPIDRIKFTGNEASVASLDVADDDVDSWLFAPIRSDD